MLSFPFVSGYFFFNSFVIYLWTYWFFGSMLFSLHMFVGCFPVFLWLISSLILVTDLLLWLEKMFDMFSVFLSALKLVLWPNMSSILENVSCVLEKNMYSTVWGWNVLYISIKFIWLQQRILFKKKKKDSLQNGRK